MKIIVKKEVADKIKKAVKKAGKKEIKGACFAEKIDDNIFEIEDVYISKIGSFSFSNLVVSFKYRMFENKYFKKHSNDYEKHNYIGDWHSHPSFELVPSSYDKKEVIDELSKSNAHFLIQIIVKISNENLQMKCYHYNLNTIATPCEIIIEKKEI